LQKRNVVLSWRNVTGKIRFISVKCHILIVTIPQLYVIVELSRLDIEIRLITVSLISVEELLVDQLDGAIEIPEVLHFACNDRSQLLDQLKVLQMVLRKERDRNRDSQLSVTSGSSSKTQSLSATTSSVKEDLKEKVERHKKVTVQRRQEKLKQMDVEAQTLSKALARECEKSESLKVGEIENENACEL